MLRSPDPAALAAAFSLVMSACTARSPLYLMGATQITAVGDDVDAAVGLLLQVIDYTLHDRAALIVSDAEKWARAVKASGAKIE